MNARKNANCLREVRFSYVYNVTVSLLSPPLLVMLLLLARVSHTRLNPTSTVRIRLLSVCRVIGISKRVLRIFVCSSLSSTLTRV